jgi:hypothetical protein
MISQKLSEPLHNLIMKSEPALADLHRIPDATCGRRSTAGCLAALPRAPAGPRSRSRATSSATISPATWSPASASPTLPRPCDRRRPGATRTGVSISGTGRSERPDRHAAAHHQANVDRQQVMAHVCAMPCVAAGLPISDRKMQGGRRAHRHRVPAQLTLWLCGPCDGWRDGGVGEWWRLAEAAGALPPGTDPAIGAQKSRYGTSRPDQPRAVAARTAGTRAQAPARRRSPGVTRLLARFCAAEYERRPVRSVALTVVSR